MQSGLIDGEDYIVRDDQRSSCRFQGVSVRVLVCLHLRFRCMENEFSSRSQANPLRTPEIQGAVIQPADSCGKSTVRSFASVMVYYANGIIGEFSSWNLYIYIYIYTFIYYIKKRFVRRRRAENLERFLPSFHPPVTLLLTPTRIFLHSPYFQPRLGVSGHWLF